MDKMATSLSPSPSPSQSSSTISHATAHTHLHAPVGSKLRTAFLLTALILGVEVVGGLISHSLALLSDAGHVLTDIVALGLAWFATEQASRPANAHKTFGYHRTGILAALANAITLIVVVGAIAYEAIGRLRHPEAVTPWVMFVSAAVSIAVNLYIGLGLRAEGGENVNVRAAMLHVLGDVGASAAVIVGGIVILLTGWYPADPIISLLIAVLIAQGAWGILRETVNILMEATPKDVNMAQLVRDVLRMPGISDVHDLHVWSIAGGMNALSMHVQVADRPVSSCDALLTQLNSLLARDYHIAHTTVQFECAGCVPSTLYCALDSGEEVTHQHQHPPLHVGPQDPHAQLQAHPHEQTSDGVDATATSTASNVGHPQR